MLGHQAFIKSFWALEALFNEEIGIATGKLHARGPVGADQLTSFKYLVTGDGTIRP